MSTLDIWSFVLATIGGLIASIAALLGTRTDEGRDALEPESGDQKEAADLLGDARATLARKAGVTERRRRAAQLIGIALILLGVIAFVMARLSPEAA